MKPNSKLFKIGETVAWTSSANGNETTKTGEVICIIPPGHSQKPHIMSLIATGKYRAKVGLRYYGSIRAHESYIVAVEIPNRSVQRLYRPVVSKLRATSKPKKTRKTAVAEAR